MVYVYNVYIFLNLISRPCSIEFIGCWILNNPWTMTFTSGGYLELDWFQQFLSINLGHVWFTGLEMQDRMGNHRIVNLKTNNSLIVFSLVFVCQGS